MNRLYLYLNHTKGEPRQTIVLNPQHSPITLGRARRCTVQLDDALVADVHAELRWDEAIEQWRVIDLGSQIGTYIQRLDEADAEQETAVAPHTDEPLTLDSRLIIARFVLTFGHIPEENSQLSTSNSDQPTITDKDPLLANSMNDAADATPEKQPIKKRSDKPAVVHTPTKNNGKGPPPTKGITVWGQKPTQFPDEFRQLGLEPNHSRLVQYLPALYDVPFMHSFLGIFESLLAPMMWTGANIDIYLDPDLTPAHFLPWLAGLYGFEFDHTWGIVQQRTLVRTLPSIFRLWGTKTALKTILEIYTNEAVEVVDDDPNQPHQFRVYLNLPKHAVERSALERLILHHKPAHTNYELCFLDDG